MSITATWPARGMLTKRRLPSALFAQSAPERGRMMRASVLVAFASDTLGSTIETLGSRLSTTT